MSLLALAARVLRDPTQVIEDGGEDLAVLAPGLLALTALGAALFGAVIGSYRGGIQLAFAALKMPIFFLLPVIISLPAVRAIFAGVGLDLPWRRVALAGLVGMARSAVLAAAVGPVLWLFYSLNPDYHVSVVVMAGALAVIGLPGLRTFTSALPDGGSRRWLAAAAALATLGFVTMQTGWVLRPFIARPTAEVTLLRPLEEDVFSALSASSRSARGDFREEWETEAPSIYSLH